MDCDLEIERVLWFFRRHKSLVLDQMVVEFMRWHVLGRVVSQSHPESVPQPQQLLLERSVARAECQ